MKRMNEETMQTILLEQLPKILQEHIPGTIVTAEQKRANNGGVLKAISVRTGNVGRLFYLQSLCNMFNDEDASIDDILDFILFESQKTAPFNAQVIATEAMLFEKCQAKIFLHLINRELNRELLAGIPYRDFEDLSIVYRVFAEETDNGFFSLLINNNMLELWGIDEETLYQNAFKNTEALLGAELACLGKVLKDVGWQFDVNSPELDVAMLISTNKYKIYGTFALVSPEILDRACEMFDVETICIIPSSVHELLIVPCENTEQTQYLNDLVSFVNQNHVLNEEVLGTHVYFYDRKTKELTCDFD